MMLDPRDKVLVFDDLERSAMPILQALAIVDSFARSGSKVLVVANEVEIERDGGSEARAAYERQKEKFVGKTLRIGSEVRNVLPVFVRQMRNETARETMTRLIDPVLDIVDASGNRNLRSLRQGIEDFDQLIGVVDDELSEHPRALDEVLLHLLAVEIEFRSGSDGLTFDQIRGLAEERWNALFSKGPSEHASKLIEKYPTVFWADPIIPYPHLANLLRSGTIEQEGLLDRIRNHPRVRPREVIPPWRALWSWTDLPRARYLEERELVLSRFGSGHLRAIFAIEETGHGRQTQRRVQA